MTPAIEWQELIDAAIAARARAYAPHSNFPVGAALLAESGEIFVGCNVENASLGLTTCAERNAIAAAVVAGQTKFRALAVCASPLATPCGACRQIILEFGDQIDVLAFDAANPNERRFWKSGDLLPDSFRL